MRWKELIINKYYACDRFIRFVLKHFVQDDCPYIASALAFTSLLAVVPLMIVSLSIFTTFPIFKDFSQPLQNFIFTNFIPTTGAIVQGYLQQFTSQVSKLPVWGILILLVTAFLMLFTIERAMNKIWRVSSGRHGVSAFLLYWAILTLAPILIGLSIAISSYLFSTPLLLDNPLLSLVIYYSPFFLSLLGFIFLYTIVPNCPVKIRHAFCGSLVATILFETAKEGFAYFLTRYNVYELIYGAFAILPLFFIWVYWVWVITLLGAEISYAFSVHHQRRSGPALDGFSHSLLWLYELWQAQQRAKGLTLNELIDASHQPFAVDADEMINTLIDSELIHCTADGHYMLNRELKQISLYELSQMLPYRLPSHIDLEYLAPPLEEQWSIAFRRADEELQKIFSINLETLFKI
ncbi:YihY family inner membrane protein [Legionella sp. km772]|uniref:YihY family inner membrane protein n=1 Tax=Legionella sp. km772 TaxID=2498111 RepID=UPI000F8F53AF|nr:YihY family inner membrane protein [Legionella sp. km772]RUR08387.1 YihY family inner membrane protein [Legionella sp. km772]